MTHGYYLSAHSLNTSFRDRVEDASGVGGGEGEGGGGDRKAERCLVLARSRISNRRITSNRRPIKSAAAFDIFYAACAEINIPPSRTASAQAIFEPNQIDSPVFDTIIGEIWSPANHIASRIRLT